MLFAFALALATATVPLAVTLASGTAALLALAAALLLLLTLAAMASTALLSLATLAALVLPFHGEHPHPIARRWAPLKTPRHRGAFRRARQAEQVLIVCGASGEVSRGQGSK